MSHASRIGLAAVSLALISGCASGPLVSKRIDLAVDSSATQYGSYCLPRILVAFSAFPAGGSVPQNNAGANGEETQSALDQGGMSAHGETVLIDQVVVPDSSRLYRLEYLEDELSHDIIKVQYEGHTDKKEGRLGRHFFRSPTNCLLKYVSSDTTSKAPEIVKQFATAVLRASTGAPGATIQSGGVKTPAVSPISLILDIGPATEAAEEKRVNDALKAAGFGFSVSFSPALGQPFVPPAADANRNEGEGIFFVHPWPYKVTLHRGSDNGGPAIAESLVFASAGAPVQMIGISRSAFVQRKTTLSLSHGFPTEIATDKPSEVLGFARIPLDITTAIVDAPIKRLQARTTKTNEEKNLATARKNLLIEQGELIKQQRAYIKLLQEGAAQSQPSAARQAAAPAAGEEDAGASSDSAAEESSDNESSDSTSESSDDEEE